MNKYKKGDIVYVIDWMQKYSDMTKWSEKTHQRENVFPLMKTKVPDYCTPMFHSKHKDYKYEIVEIFKHHRDNKNLFLLASTNSDIEPLRCYVIIGEKGISTLTPKQVTNNNFNALIEANLGKWDRDNIDKEKVPKEIKSVFYDENDNVLFGRTMTKGLVSYHYLESKYSKDDKPIYLGSSVLYDGKGNKDCPDKGLIKPFEFIKNVIE